MCMYIYIYIDRYVCIYIYIYICQYHIKVVVAGVVSTKVLLEVFLFDVCWFLGNLCWPSSTMTTSTTTTFA